MIWMRAAFIFLCSFYSFYADAASWTPSPPGMISNTSTTEGTVFVSFIPTTKQYVATWSNNSNHAPTYSLYTQGIGWSAPLPIFLTAQTQSRVNTAVNPVTGETIAAWVDRSSGHPTYSIYTPGLGWSTPLNISTILGTSEVFLSFDALTGQFLATWNNPQPFYSFFTAGSWSTALPLLGSSGASQSPSTAVNPATGQILAVWCDDITTDVFYSLYTPGPGWSTAGALATPFVVLGQPFVSFDPITGQFIGTWNDVNGRLNFAFFTAGSGWGPLGVIHSTITLGDIFTTVDPNTGMILATWAGGLDVAYSFFTPGSGWGPQGSVGPYPSAPNVICSAFSFLNNQFVATWTTNNTPVLYAFYPGLAPSQPSHFEGVQKTDNFAVVSERFNSLSWQRTSGIQNYYLYRNGILIAVLDGTADSYQDHNQSHHDETYSLVGVTNGVLSEPATIIVGSNPPAPPAPIPPPSVLPLPNRPRPPMHPAGEEG